MQQRHDSLRQRLGEMQREQDAVMRTALSGTQTEELESTIMDVEQMVQEHEELERRLRERRSVTNKAARLETTGLKPEVKVLQGEMEALEDRYHALHDRFNRLKVKNRSLMEKNRMWSVAEEMINKHFRAANPAIKVRVQKADLIEKIGVLLDESANVRNTQNHVERENEELSLLKRESDRRISSLKQRIKNGVEERSLLQQALDSNGKEMELCRQVMQRLQEQMSQMSEENRRLQLEMHRERDLRKTAEEALKRVQQQEQQNRHPNSTGGTTYG